MVYKYGEWILYEIRINVPNAGNPKMYFFCKKTPKRGTPCDMPKGYEVGVNQKTGMPFLRKNK